MSRRIDEAEVRVIAIVMGERYEVNGMADISEGVHTNLFKGVMEFDPELITRKVKQELAGKLRELADKLDNESA